MNGLPTVPVHDLYIHPRDNDLIAGTHGRGAWIVDNISSLQQLTSGNMDKDVYLMDIRPEVQWVTSFDFPWGTDKEFKKANPKSGSNISYFLKSELTDSVDIEILDITGDVLRNIKGPKQAGLNNVFWDFRKNPIPRPPSTNPNQQSRFSRRRTGALVKPGEFLVRITADSKILQKKAIVDKDDVGYIGR